MHLVQPDGSTAAMCGNGARCVAAWAADRTDSETIVVETDAGDRRATVEEGADGTRVTVEMGRPSFGPDDVPLAGDEPLIEQPLQGHVVTAISTGVPHAVVFVEDVDAVDLETMAPPLRNAAEFPEGANVTVASRAGNDPVVYRQRTYERGVEGETASCGTGAVAIAAVSKRLVRHRGFTVLVRPPGGELEITVPDSDPATLAGPVEQVGTGRLDADGTLLAEGEA
jgi:diaminopimelate epimerase